MTTTTNLQPVDADRRALQNLLRQGLGVVKELWSFSADDWVTSVHSGDIDGDGELEVVIGSRDGYVRVLTRKGELKWSEIEEHGEWVGCIYGVDSANALDSTRVIVGMRNHNRVVGLTETGKRLWTYTAGQVVRRVRVADIDQDGKAEVMVGSEDFSIHVLNSENGELRWKYKTNGWIRSVVSFDIDNDGQIELLAASGDQYVYVLDNQGNLKKKLYIGSKVHSLFAADIDKDGQVEILFGSSAKDLCAMTLDGQVKWKFQPDNRIHSINVVDLNKDGLYEVVAGSEDEHIYILDCQGNLLWKHFLGHRIFSLYTIDLNRDGIHEILAGADDNNVWVLSVEIPPGLLSSIKEAHAHLGSPHSSTFNFSSTEKALLHDLISEPGLGEQAVPDVTLPEALALADPFAALAALLYFKNRRVQMLWERADLGHVRIATLDRNASGPARELVIGNDEGMVTVLTIDGTTLWSCPIDERVRSLDIGDIDEDGEAELLVGSASGNVYALSTSKHDVKFQSHFRSDWVESIAIIHPPETNMYEMVLGTRRSREIQIHHGDFNLVSEPFSLPQSVQILCTSDINGDGVDEILAGSVDNGVYVYTRDGNHLWMYQTGDRVKAISVCDLDNDGQVEILVGSEDRCLYVLDNQGHLRWRYYTQHRVLSLDVCDVDGDGEMEIFAGSGNGQLYILNGSGDVLWRYEANDRIRSVFVDDIDEDGNVEILLGTEDRLYMLQYINQKQLSAAIEQRWQALLQHYTPAQLLARLIEHPAPGLRAFALNRLAAGLVPLQFAYIEQLRNDKTIEVKKALTEIAPVLSQLKQGEIRQILNALLSDPQREIRMALVDSFADLCRGNPQLGFEYLERFTRNPDMWMRRAVVRQLDRLVSAYPEQVFRLLFHIILVNRELWIREEAARVLAHYLDIHTRHLLRAIRLLVAKNLPISLLRMITYCARNPLVQGIFKTFLALSEELSGENVLGRLERVVIALEGRTRQFALGEVMFQLYHELRQLHCIRTIEEMAQYQCDFWAWQMPGEMADQEGEETYFSPTFQVLFQLNPITEALRIYLRRDGLGERISSLLDAEQAIDQLTTEMSAVYHPDCPDSFPDLVILKLLLQRWRHMVHTELSLIRGRADLRPELGAQRMVYEETIVVPLRIQNIGRSPADNVLVVLLPAQDESFTIEGPAQQRFATISASSPITAEFTLKPRQNSFRLAFHITYDDAEGKGKKRSFGERLDLVARPRRVVQLHNPYYTGTAVQKLSMFYGREQEISLLQQDFVYSSAPAVVVLYGQRRSGKSSLIYKLLLSNLLDPHIPVRIDMQHETLNFSVEKFLRNVAYAVHKQICQRGYTQPFPDLAIFKEDAVFAFDRFLDDVEAWLDERKLVLLIDEFEVLDEKAVSDQIDHHLFDHLRSLVQERQCMHLLLAGTHKLQDLTSAYWSIFFNLAIHRRISKLTPEAARQLICEPMRDVLEYDPFAVEKIHMLTGDQPYLIQLFCHCLVRHCINSTRDYITINDVNVVLEEVKQSGRLYFNWIWDQASQEERVILSIIALASGDSEQLVSFNDIERIFRDYHLSYTRESLLASLHNLCNRDVISEVSSEHRYKIAVGLTRSWLHESKPIQRVVLGQA
ncbi:MAG TPA: FG-GAP-like repeat-containing protein [Ktedonobacteraceae bacterium]|nr:FG-GAP-like repeat-containing protein [Ktedonobacteraceae bacterium]